MATNNDETVKILCNALEWALDCLEGGPEDGCDQYKTSRQLVAMLSGKYGWIGKAEELMDTLIANEQNA